MSKRARFLCFALLATLATSAARAEAPDLRTAGVARKAGKLVIGLGLQDLFGPREIERLLSGFSTRVLIRVALLRDGGEEPVARAMRLAEIVYDLWDEKLRVRVSSHDPDKPDTYLVATPKAAVDVAAALANFAIADIDKLDPSARYYLSLRADLNPISDELVGNVRRWLSRPSGHGRFGSGDSFFGSFVSVFVNPRIDDSERQLRILSRPFAVPQGGAP